LPNSPAHSCSWGVRSAGDEEVGVGEVMGSL
jgi:hypothetical protein